MKALLVASALMLALVPALPLASACINNCEPLVGHCVGADKCGGHDACVWFSEEVPACVDVPQPCEGPYFGCTPEIPLGASLQPPQTNPLVGVCFEPKAHDCYGGHDVCVTFSLEVPFCTDLPGTTVSCLTPACIISKLPPCACMPPPPIEASVQILS